ncbi:MAG: metallophosphoesterase [Halobacteriaceae archaeon]
MAAVDPVPDAPAAITHFDDERALVIADYHAGIEAALRAAGVELASGGSDRRERVLSLLRSTGADRLLVVGDLGHTIGAPDGSELEELETLVDALSVPVTLVPGNHDAGLGAALDIEVTAADGVRRGDIGFVHGHSWPSAEVLTAPVVCVGHEHPMVRLEDEVGGSHVDRVWLRGALDPTPFGKHGTPVPEDPGELVVIPAFNDRSGGTWVNVEDQEFLAPFLPDALPTGHAYLLDGTDLGPFRNL